MTSTGMGRQLVLEGRGEQLGPQDLFDEPAARRALGQLETVAARCERLLGELPRV